MAFVFVSGRPSLDFVGTLKWRDDRPEEQLDSPATLASWLCLAGVTGADVPVSTARFAQAVQIREAVYRAVRARMARRRIAADDVAILNAAARRRVAAPVLAADGRVTRSVTVDAALAVLARDAIDLIGGAEFDRVRRCANTRCTRLYVDASRGRTRRWCGMAECGNAAKVAAFRARQRSS